MKPQLSKANRLWPLLLLAPFCSPLLAGDSDSFQAVDHHALAAPKEAEKSVASLAGYLANSAKNDSEKVRAIFRWVTDRIRYDVESLLKRQVGDNSPETVLKSRKAVCQGYAAMIERLCQEAGLEATQIRGFAKGYGTLPTDKAGESNHRWNAVKIDGQWRLLDATWGAGYLSGKRFIRDFNDYFFFTPPEQLVFSHFPVESQWQLLTPPVPAKEFTRYAKEVDSRLFYYGVSADAVKNRLADAHFREFAKVFDNPAGALRILEAPLDRFLSAGTRYRFKIAADSTEYPGIAIVNRDEWTVLRNKGNMYDGVVTLQADKDCRLVRYKEGKNDELKFFVVLEYVVE
jgi:hypothetical protein